jgi:hypothetical protein
VIDNAHLCTKLKAQILACEWFKPFKRRHGKKPHEPIHITDVFGDRFVKTFVRHAVLHLLPHERFDIRLHLWVSHSIGEVLH